MVRQHVRHFSEVHKSLSRIGEKYPGISGNCAVFAQRLRKILGPEATYIMVTGGHYEYADHVAVWYKGKVLDSDGVSALEKFKKKWGQGDFDSNDEWYIPQFEFWPKPVSDEDDELILKAADEGGLFCIPIDPDKLEQELRRELVPELYRHLSSKGGPVYVRRHRRRR